jgi:hypothetical protein
MASPSTPTPTRTSRVGALEASLELLPRRTFLDGLGMAVHGPMGAEALSGLGHDDIVVDWVEAYMARHAPHDAPSPVGRIDPTDRASWLAALGDHGRMSDWREMFEAALAEQPWTDVLATWVPRLIDGYGGFLTHGLLRTAHAVRVLEAVGATRQVALDELAMGLAFWAGSHQRLPGDVRLDGDVAPADALAGIGRPSGPWTPVERAFFRPLDDVDGFASTVESVAAPWSSDPLGDLTLLFARAVAAWPEAPTDAVVHTVTPIVAARTLLRHLPATAAAAVYAAGWQVGAGILACFTPPRDVDLGRGAEVEPLAPPELVARAVANRAPHAIKMTEACLQEHALRPDPAYLLAAQRAVVETEPW